MDGWMDGWMDEWMGEWMDGWMNGWMHGWMYVREREREATKGEIIKTEGGKAGREKQKDKSNGGRLMDD
jgi:hypothetical protein